MKPHAQLVKVVPLRMQAKTGPSKVLRAVAAGMESAAAAVAVKAGLQDCWEMSWSVIKNWPSWKDSSSSRWKSQGRCAKSAWQEERDIGGQEEMTALEKQNLWNRIKPVECDFAGRVQVRHRRLRQPTFSVQDTATSLRGSDVEGGCTRAVCFDCWDKRDKPLGKETSPSTLRFVQAQNISADGKTSRKKWKVMRTDLLGSSGMKEKAKPETRGLCKRRTSRTSGTRVLTSQSCGRCVASSALNVLKAPMVLGKLPDMTSWAIKFLMEHRSEIAGCALSKVEDARLDRLTGCSRSFVLSMGLAVPSPLLCMLNLSSDRVSVERCHLHHHHIISPAVSFQKMLHQDERPGNVRIIGA